MHAGKWDNNTPDGYGARFDRNGNLIDVSNYETVFAQVRAFLLMKTAI